jgi:hypothetical protein
MLFPDAKFRVSGQAASAPPFQPCQFPYESLHLTNSCLLMWLTNFGTNFGSRIFYVFEKNMLKLRVFSCMIGKVLTETSDSGA